MTAAPSGLTAWQRILVASRPSAPPLTSTTTTPLTTVNQLSTGDGSSQAAPDVTPSRRRPREDSIQMYSRYVCPILAYASGMSPAGPGTGAAWAEELRRIGHPIVDDFVGRVRAQAATELAALRMENDYFAASQQQALLDRVLATVEAQRLFERLRVLYAEDHDDDAQHLQTITAAIATLDNDSRRDILLALQHGLAPPSLPPLLPPPPLHSNSSPGFTPFLGLSAHEFAAAQIDAVSRETTIPLCPQLRVSSDVSDGDAPLAPWLWIQRPDEWESAFQRLFLLRYPSRAPSYVAEIDDAVNMFRFVLQSFRSPDLTSNMKSSWRSLFLAHANLLRAFLRGTHSAEAESAFHTSFQKDWDAGRLNLPRIFRSAAAAHPAPPPVPARAAPPVINVDAAAQAAANARARNATAASPRTTTYGTGLSRDMVNQIAQAVNRLQGGRGGGSARGGGRRHIY